MKTNIIAAAILLFMMLFRYEDACATVLIIAPHPDDEALMSSGVIYSALQRGEPVKVVLMTNGDFLGQPNGYYRQSESVNAMTLLGLNEDDIIFLGYPDGGLKPIYDTHARVGDAYLSQAGQTRTYGRRGLGRADYHTYRFGAPARYNRVNVLADLQALLGEYRAQHIFVTNEFDRHDDHSITYRYVRDALVAIMAEFPDYRPTLHSTVIHGGDDSVWPAAADPGSPFSEPPLINSTPLRWNVRESFLLPRGMRSLPLGQNLKNRVISRYPSQLSQYLLNFVHQDEIFWAENIYGGNRPPVAHAGSDQVAAQGTRVTLDGSLSFDPDNDSLAYRWRQVEGAPVTLWGGQRANPSFIAPQASAPLTFQLTVSDGAIESYPSGVTVTYPNLVQLTITTTVSGNGSITCFPGATVDYEAVTSCVVTPAAGHHIVSVTVDGNAQAIADPERFTRDFGAVTSDHRISAVFAPARHLVTFASAGNGTISGAASQTISNGGSTTPVTAIPAAGYHFVNWTAPGGFTSTANPLTLAGVAAGRTVTANFAIDTRTVTPQAGAGGAISPATPRDVSLGGTSTFTITAAEGYAIVSVAGCGGSLSGAVYTTGPVTADCVVTATFAAARLPASVSVTGAERVDYTLADAVKAQQHVMGKVPLMKLDLDRYDVAPLGGDGRPRPNGVVDVADVVILLRRLVGVIIW